jgi:hypothetical protein
VILNIARKIAALNEVAITMLPNMAIINQPYSKINFALFISFSLSETPGIVPGVVYQDSPF